MALRYELAFLEQPPSSLLVGDGNLTDEHREWMQLRDRWSIFYYHHPNVITIGTQTYALDAGDMAFYPPSSRASHAHIGAGTHFEFFSFKLLSTSGARAAIPHVARNMERILPDLRRASARIVDTPYPAIAYVWHTLWAVGQTTSVLRGQEVLYEAEAYILRHLEEKIVIPDLCEELKVSQRKLLAAFRSEHGVSVQEFILRKRVQEASRMLIGTTIPIKEVAAKIGIFDLQHFNKLIRSSTGKSPRTIRDLSVASKATPEAETAPDSE